MDEQLQTVVGLADLCELMSALWVYPSESLAKGLVDGAVAADALSCLKDAGASKALAEAAAAALEPLGCREWQELLDCLRKGSSILFFTPGDETPVWPYEAAFRFVADGREGMPTLFRAPATVDVEAQMRSAGVLPQDARKEPADSVWNEFEFLSYLFGKQAEALQATEEGACEAEDECAANDASVWQERAARFWNDHAAKWLPAFMERVSGEALSGAHSYGVEYAALAQVGAAACEVICEHMRS